jgi:hypothetical protein
VLNVGGYLYWDAQVRGCLYRDVRGCFYSLEGVYTGMLTLEGVYTGML